jgi:hypothetical protein
LISPHRHPSEALYNSEAGQAGIQCLCRIEVTGSQLSLG